MAVLLRPEVFAQRALTPKAALRKQALERRALQPIAVLKHAVVQPSTTPGTVGVAGDPPPRVVHWIVVPVDDRIWPEVPGDPAQSMMGVKRAVMLPVQLIGAGMVQKE
jgi:hypothetical protein